MPTAFFFLEFSHVTLFISHVTLFQLVILLFVTMGQKVNSFGKIVLDIFTYFFIDAIQKVHLCFLGSYLLVCLFFLLISCFNIFLFIFRTPDHHGYIKVLSPPLKMWILHNLLSSKLRLPICSNPLYRYLYCFVSWYIWWFSW